MREKMKNKKSIIIMIIIIVLILALITAIFLYNKFQQDEVKKLTEEANKILQQDFINDEIDNKIKTKQNYAVVEKTIKEYISNLKNIYLEIEELNSKVSADEIFSAENLSDDKLEMVVDEYKQKSKENFEKIKNLEKEENILEVINSKDISSKRSYYVELYKTIMLSDSMKSQYQKIEEKAEKSKDKLYDNLTIVLNAKKYLDNHAKNWEIKDEKIVFKNPNTMIEYYNIINQIKS